MWVQGAGCRVQGAGLAPSTHVIGCGAQTARPSVDSPLDPGPLAPPPPGDSPLTRVGPRHLYALGLRAASRRSRESASQCSRQWHRLRVRPHRPIHTPHQPAEWQPWEPQLARGSIWSSPTSGSIWDSGRGCGRCTAEPSRASWCMVRWSRYLRWCEHVHVYGVVVRGTSRERGRGSEWVREVARGECMADTERYVTRVLLWVGGL